jgi:hypothetical protein
MYGRRNFVKGQGSHTLLEEKGIGLSPGGQKVLERRERRISPEKGVEQLVGTLGREGINSELPVVGLFCPKRGCTQGGQFRPP